MDSFASSELSNAAIEFHDSEVSCVEAGNGGFTVFPIS